VTLVGLEHGQGDVGGAAHTPQLCPRDEGGQPVGVVDEGHVRVVVGPEPFQPVLRCDVEAIGVGRVARDGEGVMPEHDGATLPIGERLKRIRQERGWSQADLAAKVGQISRYENGHMTPSAEAVARLAGALDVSCDYLLIDDSPRRPLHAPEDVLGERLTTITELTDDEISVVRSVIDGLVAKNRLKALVGGLG
jgi:transcriptional regulator with XRE-family HTH domain